MTRVYIISILLSFYTLHATDCNVFGCTCQGMSNYYGTKAGKNYGCAPPWAQDWWVASNCGTNPHQEAPYPGCGQTVCDTNVVVGLTMSTSTNHPGDIVQDNNCCSNDFNANAGGDWIFLFQERYAHNPKGEGLVHLLAYMDNPKNCPAGYTLVTGCCGNNFNNEAGGDVVWMCAKYERYGPFIDEIRMYGSQDSHWDPPCDASSGWYKVDNDGCEDGCDFNEGTHGRDHVHIYLCYHKTQDCFLPSRIDDTKKVCQQIVDETNASNGFPIQEIMIEGSLIPVSWDVYEWTPSAKARNYETTVIGPPKNCQNQEECWVEFTETEIHTKQWNLEGGIGIDASWGFEVSGGVPELFDITGKFDIGVGIDIGIGVGGLESFESTTTNHYSCATRDVATVCSILTQRGEYLVNGKATPIFKFEGQDIKCKDFVETTHIEWWGEHDILTKTSEQILCEDDKDFIGCDTATEALCQTQEITRWNCPHSCNKWGWGPAQCANGAECGYVPVPVEECPSPASLEPVDHMFLDCNEAVFTPTAICEAYKPFTIENAPEWHIENCPGKKDANGEVFMHSIWTWSCTSVGKTLNQRADWQAERSGSQNLGSSSQNFGSSMAGDKKQAFKETWTERHYKEHTWTPMSILEDVNAINVITFILAIIGAGSIVIALKNCCMKTSAYTTIEETQSEI